jgi:hypothetical protein
MPTVSTMDQRAHRERGYRVKDPGVGGVPAGCHRADPPTHPPKGTTRGAIQTPTKTSATGSNLLRSTPSIIADVAGISSPGRRCLTAGRCALRPAARVTASRGTGGAGGRRCDRGHPQRRRRGNPRRSPSADGQASSTPRRELNMRHPDGQRRPTALTATVGTLTQVLG